MDWWILEIVFVLVMVAVVAVLGPLIKRFGKAYAADVFRANPRTGKSYLVLMDFAYYMIFGAYVLFVIKWEPDTGWAQEVNADQLQASAVRLGGMVLLTPTLLQPFSDRREAVIGAPAIAARTSAAVSMATTRTRSSTTAVSRESSAASR